MERIQADSLADARDAAVRLLRDGGNEYGAIDILWDAYPARDASLILRDTLIREGRY
jgi:hypothetical protein